MAASHSVITSLATILLAQTLFFGALKMFSILVVQNLLFFFSFFFANTDDGDCNGKISACMALGLMQIMVLTLRFSDIIFHFLFVCYPLLTSSINYFY